jgi:hypothetical protein|tara:strand:- start:232 stop:477 length:246 start_codon:yes stop_codon:yes gene_type:complete
MFLEIVHLPAFLGLILALVLDSVEVLLQRVVLVVKRLSLPTTNVAAGNQAVGIDVSQLCPTAISNCNGGPRLGMEILLIQL